MDWKLGLTSPPLAGLDELSWGPLWWSPPYGHSRRNLWWERSLGSSGINRCGDPEWKHTDFWDKLWTEEMEKNTNSLWSTAGDFLENIFKKENVSSDAGFGLNWIDFGKWNVCVPRKHLFNYKRKEKAWCNMRNKCLKRQMMIVLH